MAEIEISLMSRAALKPRIPGLEQFREIISANAQRRNQSPQPINWQFTTSKARTKLKRLYPTV
ncbi:MAG: hypothetical protein ACI8UO_005821 [Verrucomicrobiales bacterium]|jgi:hypothetical protein